MMGGMLNVTEAQSRATYTAEGGGGQGSAGSSHEEYTSIGYGTERERQNTAEAPESREA